ncbi:MAG: response regulator [Candidatus Vogelbacteria bacterium]|nr:response regulator [Candidatus Vogelbacteria bacterium]
MQNGKTILIVEDDTALRSILVEKLSSSGYRTLEAGNGVEALEMLRANKPDLVLLDIIMPQKNGMEVLEEKRADPSIADIPVIIISNSGQPVEIERAKALGVADFLIKTTFDPTEVLEKITNTLHMETTNANKNTEDGQGTRAAPIRNHTVLVIEDDTFLRELLVEKLKTEGFIVEGATDGKESSSILEKSVPDLIILDLILPDINGFEILEKIKKEPKTAEIPVIVLTNLDQKEDIDRAMSSGAIDFMIKANFSLSEIISRVKKHLS